MGRRIKLTGGLAVRSLHTVTGAPLREHYMHKLVSVHAELSDIDKVVALLGTNMSAEKNN